MQYKSRYLKVYTVLFIIVAITWGISSFKAVASSDTRLLIDPATYTKLNVTVDGSPITIRRYEAVYVSRPVKMAEKQPQRQMGPGGSPTSSEGQTLKNPYVYQSLYVFVPETATNKSAIILNVNNGGWFASELRAGIENGGKYVSNSNTDKVGAALAAGYVYVDVGTRGRGIVGADGSYPGHAPAAVVDTKAAIRWLRLNDDALAGSAERIVVTGTSGGGGLTAVVAASGDSQDFLPYLQEIGAAGVTAEGKSTLSDAVFAAIAYCPITDLGHTDMAYEWLYGAHRKAENTAGGSLSKLQSAASSHLASGYAQYLSGLGLELSDGRSLIVDTMPEAISTAVIAEVERHIAAGGSIPARGQPFDVSVPGMRGDSMRITQINNWVTVEGGKVTDFNLQEFLAFVANVTPLKPVPAFDRSHNTGNIGIDGENTLFGSPSQAWSNFTPYAWNANDVAGDGSGKDDTGLDWQQWIMGDGALVAEQLRLINPFTYLRSETHAAPYWYVRFGMIDRDNSFATEVALARAIAVDPDVHNLDFAFPWMTPHSGDYDVQAAYRWLAKILADRK